MTGVPLEIRCRQYSDDDLELYLMVRLNADITREIDEHLLLCGTCRRTVEELDDFLRLLRISLAEVAELTPEQLRREGGRFVYSRLACS